MNFDDIKQAMDDEPNDLNIPLSVKDIKSSHSAMKKIRKRLIIEILMGLAFIVYLICIPMVNKMHDSAQVLYNLTMFNVLVIYFAWLLAAIRLVKGLGISDLTSRQAIEIFIIKIKAWIEICLYFSFGFMAAICVPVLIINFGSVRLTRYYTDKYLYLNFPLSQIFLVMIGILIFAFLCTLLNKYIYKKMYGKQLSHLESIIGQFN